MVSHRAHSHEPRRDRWRGADITLATGAVRVVPNVNGPVVFTPSGSTVIGSTGSLFVSDGGYDAGISALVLIDVATATTTSISTGFELAPTYFVTSDGHRIVVLPYEQQPMHVQIAVADLTMQTMTATSLIDRATNPSGPLVERTGHNELWFLDTTAATANRLDLVSGAHEAIPLGFAAQSMGYLPMRDRFVFNEKTPPAPCASGVRRHEAPRCASRIEPRPRTRSRPRAACSLPRSPRFMLRPGA